MRRLEAALTEPSRRGSMVRSATPGVRGEGVKTHSPHAAPGPSGRGSLCRPRPMRPVRQRAGGARGRRTCGRADTAPAACESADPPESDNDPYRFSRSSAAKSKQVGRRPTRLRNSRPSRPATVLGLATQPAAESASRTKQRFVAPAAAGEPQCRHGWSANRRTSTTNYFGVAVRDQVSNRLVCRFRARPPQPGLGVRPSRPTKWLAQLPDLAFGYRPHRCRRRAA